MNHIDRYSGLYNAVGKGKDVANSWQSKNSWNSVYQGKCM